MLKRAKSKKVVFLGELPWMATRRSGVLDAFERFWNQWASRQDKLVLVICGSAASWMIAKVLIDRLILEAAAPLRHEFNELYAALFEHHERHLLIIRTVAGKSMGMTREELARKANGRNATRAWNLTNVLKELEASGFILRVFTFAKKERDALYRFVDGLLKTWMPIRSSTSISAWLTSSDGADTDRAPPPLRSGPVSQYAASCAHC